MKIRLLKLLDAFFGKMACMLLGRLRFPGKDGSPGTGIHDPVKKILFIRPGGMGDFLYLLPALHAVREKYPRAQITVLAEKRNGAVAALTRDIDSLFCYDTHPFSTLFLLWRGSFDVVVDSEQLHHFSAVFAFLTRAGIRIGFKTNPLRTQLYTHPIDYSREGWEPREFLRLLEPIGIKRSAVGMDEAIRKEKVRLTPVPEPILALLRRRRLLTVIGPEGKDPYRRWEPEKYRELIAWLLRNPHRSVVLVGGKTDRAITEEILSEIHHDADRILSLVGKTSFLQLCRILAEAEIFIGPDSGGCILAAAMGTKSVALYRAVKWRKWGFPSPDCAIVRPMLPCAPCSRLEEHRPCRSNSCMAEIRTRDVLLAVESLGCR